MQVLRYVTITSSSQENGGKARRKLTLVSCVCLFVFYPPLCTGISIQLLNLMRRYYLLGWRNIAHNTWTTSFHTRRLSAQVSATLHDKHDYSFPYFQVLIIILCAVQRFMKEDRLPHLLFYGPPGTGKTSTILACAKMLYSAREFNSMVLEVCMFVYWM